MGRTENKFLVSENTIMWAFRYALGRKTGAVTDVCMTLKNNWEDLEVETQFQIQDEIREAIRTERAGMDCDVREWEEILELVSSKSLSSFKDKLMEDIKQKIKKIVVSQIHSVDGRNEIFTVDDKIKELVDLITQSKREVLKTERKKIKDNFNYWIDSTEADLPLGDSLVTKTARECYRYAKGLLARVMEIESTPKGDGNGDK